MMDGLDDSAVDSEFVLLDEDYDDPDFYGGAFEGTIAYADIVIFNLYSVLPDGETDRLRIETRVHVDGLVESHAREERALDESLTVADTGTPLASFCRQHHRARAREELRAAMEDSRVESP